MFTHHVFISYANKDNFSTTDEKEGWISKFRELFKQYLGRRLGTDAVIWRDREELPSNSVLDPSIVGGLKESALLVTILSPYYTNSEWCRKEVSTFWQLSHESGGPFVSDGSKVLSRVLKVIILPPDSLTTLPEPLREQVLAYEFFRTCDKGNNHTLEFDLEEESKLLKEKTRDLAADADRVIKRLWPTPTQPSSKSPEENSLKIEEKPVRLYLATCTSDLKDTRDRLAADLKQNGYVVLPDRLLPTEIKTDFCEVVREMCQNCDISIHLIGSRYGSRPDSEDAKPLSTVELQYQIATELAKTGRKGKRLKRLIWLAPQSGSIQDDDQDKFVARLNSDASIQGDEDLIIGDYQEMRNTLHQMIKAIGDEGEETMKFQKVMINRRMVYLVCTMEDWVQGKINPLKEWLKQTGFDVERPSFEGDPTDLQKNHLDLMQRCFAVIHFYGTGTDAWLRSRRDDLRKLDINGKDRLTRPRVLFISEPDSIFKQHQLKDEDEIYTLTLDARQDFDPSALKALLQVPNKRLQQNA